jgi:hypothetical protein
VLGRHERTLAAGEPGKDDPAKNVEKSFAVIRGTAHLVPGVRRPAPRGLEYRLESDHPRPVENTRARESRRDLFLDERGTGLRVTWHPERDLVVLSVWQGDSCVGTFRMPVRDIPRLSGLLAAALGDWVGQTGPLPVAGGPGPVGSQGGGDYSLSVQQRLRLSRPVLKLRGLQHRRRRPA